MRGNSEKAGLSACLTAQREKASGLGRQLLLLLISAAAAAAAGSPQGRLKLSVNGDPVLEPAGVDDGLEHAALAGRDGDPGGGGAGPRGAAQLVQVGHGGGQGGRKLLLRREVLLLLFRLGARPPFGGPVLVVRILPEVEQPQPFSLLHKWVSLTGTQTFPPPANSQELTL